MTASLIDTCPSMSEYGLFVLSSDLSKILDSKPMLVTLLLCLIFKLTLQFFVDAGPHLSQPKADFFC